MQFKQNDGVVSITVPKDQQDTADTIVELTMDESVDGHKTIASLPL